MMYGKLPRPIGMCDINCNEMMFVMYMPIKFAYSADIRIPDHLKVFTPLVDMLVGEEYYNMACKYVYLTAKHIYVCPENMGNRPGWHSDGFGTDDINYIWSDKHSTEFCNQRFDLSEDCCESMEQMEQQANEQNVITYSERMLLRLTEENIHRVPEVDYRGMRTFVKLSVSDQQYNLIGNSHNYLFDYDWDMQERTEERNHPVKCTTHNHNL